MTQLLPYLRFATALALTGFLAAGCTRGARRADADFAAERYENAEIEYRNILQARLDPHAVKRLGLIYSREGRAPAAFVALKKSEELAPKDPEVKTALGIAYLSLRDASDALREAREVLTIQSTNGLAMTLLSDATSPGPDLRNSETFLRALPAPAGALADYHIALATLKLKAHDWTAADAELRQALTCDSKSAGAHYLLGELFLERTNIAQASNELSLAASLAPWRSALRLKNVEFQLQSGAISQPRQSLEEMIAHAPDYVPAWVALMRLDFSQKQFDDCQKVIATILGKDPENTDAATESALVDVGRSDYSAALPKFQRLATRYPHNFEANYYLGIISLAQGEQAKGRQFLSRSVDLNTNYYQAVIALAQLDLRTGNPVLAIRRLEQLIRQQPSMVEPRLLLAETYLTQQDTDRAVAVYRQITQMRPTDAKIPYLMGLALARSGDLDEAAKCFSRALELAPDSTAPLAGLVDVRLAQDHPDAALQIIQQRIDTYPKQAELWLLKAEVERTQDHSPQAEKDLNQAIALNPSLVPAYLSLAQLYVQNHQEQQALDRLNDVISRTNDVSAVMSVALIHEQLNHPDAARDAYEKALSINPRFFPALNNIASLYSEKLGQLDKAFDYAQKAREARPFDPYSADTLGWILFKRGDYSRALPMLRQGAEGEPGVAEVQYHLGMAHYMLGEEAPARLALQAAASSVASFQGKDEAARRLSILSIDPKAADPSAAKRLEEAVQHDPADPVASARLAEVDEELGLFDKAAQLYEQSLKASPSDASTMARLAALYVDRLQRPDDALQLAQKAHNIDGDNLQTCAILGRLTLDKGDFSYALALLEKAASSGSVSPRLSFDLAQAYYAAGRIADAETAMKRAAEAGNSFDHAAQAQQFLTLVKAGGTPSAAQAALPQAQETLRSNPASVPAMMVCARAFEASGDYPQAAAFYEKAAAAIPNFPPAARQLALLYTQHLDDDAKALTWGEKARRGNQFDAELTQSLGVAAYRRADYLRSAQFLRESAAHSSDSGLLQFYLGMDYFQLRQPRDSKAALQRALAMNLSDNLASEARRVLAQLNK